MDQSESGTNVNAIQSETRTQDMEGLQPIKFNIMAAMCSSNRGMGYKERLPWPKLRQDYKYYIKKTTEFVGENTDGQIIIHISGRTTWESCGHHERYQGNIRRLMVSRSLSGSNDLPPVILKVVPSFAAALEYCNSPAVRQQLNSVWVMGGAGLYQEALHHPQCNRIYLTHIHTTFPADVFFPQFEPWFDEIGNEGEGQGVIEDNGVKYEFKVYQKKGQDIHL